MAEKILVTGSSGMLGSDLVTILTDKGYEVAGADLPFFDITDPISCHNIINSFKPAIIINAAAYTNVDGAEKEKKLAFSINAQGTENIATAASETGVRIVHYSTDYIFDGRKKDPYTEEDRPNPLSVYGKSKLEGEKLLTARSPNSLIIRTEWLFGKNGKNFVRSIISALPGKTEIEVVDDQHGSPTHSLDLAKATLLLIRKGTTGIVNFTSSGATTWFDFARLILEHLDIKNVEVKPIKTAKLARPAKRPLNSLLNTEKYQSITGKKPPRFEHALKEYLDSILIK